MTPLSSQIQAVRYAAGIFNTLSHGLLSVRGNDRVSFLHNLVTHDIKGLSEGQGRPACLLDRQGRIRSAFLVHAFSGQLILEMGPEDIARTRGELEKYLITENVELEAIGDRFRILPVHGRNTFTLLSQIWPGILLPSGNYEHREGPPGSPVRWVVRWDLFRLPGIHLWIESGKEVEVRQKFLEEKEALGIQEISPEAFEVLRIESGIPWLHKEMDETVILNELETEEFVSFTKGCFIGQEIVARIKYRAHPPRLLKGFLMEGQQIPPSPCPLFLKENPVGGLTSCCFSPTLNRVIALGFLKYGVTAPEVIARTPVGDLRATITELPFVKEGF